MSGPKQQVLSLKINGLFTNPNTFSEVPEGITLSQANNVVLDKDSILNSRRGFRQYGTPPSGTSQIRAMFDYKDTIIVHDSEGKLKYDAGNGVSWTTLPGTYLAPGNTTADRVGSFQSNKNLYLTTNNGLFKMTSASSTPRQAGVSAGLGGSGVTSGTTGFMNANTNVAYRIIWGYRDENQNLLLGAPSDRITVSNTSGSNRDVTLTFFIPADITPNYFYQVYRSSGSATVNDEPDDELQLVEENAPTPAQIAAGTITFTDSTPDNLRGVLIYTADSLPNGGIAGSNFQPPFAQVVATFKGYAFYGNTRTKHNLSASLIAVGAPDGIQVGDSITFTVTGGSSFQIFGSATENAAGGFFKVTTTLTPAENIDLTAQSIVNVLNTIAANNVFAAYYASGYSDLPGAMRFERLDLNRSSFYINSNRVSAFRPMITASGSTYNNTSRNEELQNRVYFSKLQQPEAVPISNYMDIGSAEEPVLALVPLRDGVIVLKTDGVFRISGTGAFSVNLVDSTVRIIAKQSVAILNNKVHFFSTQGIVAASDNSVELVSRPIETQLLELSSALYANFNDVTFAVGYESDRKYIIWTQTTSGDTYGTQAFVFNTLTGDWTRWTKPASAAIVKQQDDKLYMAGVASGELSNYVFQERKNYNLTDFADEQYSINVVSVLGTTLTVNNTALLEEGYTLQQTLAQSRIVSVNGPTSITVESIEDWIVGPATAYRPVYQYFESNQFDGGNPGMLKHWADCSAVFRSTSFDRIDVGFNADTTNETKTVLLVSPPGTGGWGTFPWGTVPWGVSNSVKARLRMAVPKMAQRSNWMSISMTLNEPFADISLAGLSLTFSQMSSRQKGASRA